MSRTGINKAFETISLSGAQFVDISQRLADARSNGRDVPRVLPSCVRAKLTLVKFSILQGGWRKRFTPTQWTSNGTANVTGNLDVTFSSLLTVNLLWRSAARRKAENI
ncbi:MAG: hypothetical protein MPJ50_05515 [Pirellulales bacterium]|nr:hypothetical protein [Pirellulales bacterium]